MIARNEHKREILLIVTVVNVGKTTVYVKHVRVVLNPQELSVVGNSAIKLKADLSELTAHQKNAIVEIKPHGDTHIWQMPFPKRPDFQVTQIDGEPHGKGYVELTSGDKQEFTFVILPDETWKFLTAPIAPVFDGKAGHKCSICGLIFLIQADTKSVICPQCKHVDNLIPKPPSEPTATTEKTAKAAEAIRTAYLPITNLYEDCTVLIEDKNMEKLKARQTQFQGYVDTFWKAFEANNVYLPPDI